MKKDPGPQKRPATGGTATAADNRGVQRKQKESPAAPLSAANVEESPHMDRGDSAGGSGQSLGDGRDPPNAPDALRRGAVDTQYGTKSSMKTGWKSGGRGGRVASAGSGSSGAGEPTEPAANPGSPEGPSGAERDTMTGSRPRSGS